MNGCAAYERTKEGREEKEEEQQEREWISFFYLPTTRDSVQWTLTDKTASGEI